MGANHGVGNAAGSRQGCDPIVHSWPLNFNSTVNRKLMRIVASIQKPVLLTIREVGKVTFNAGTTNQYKLGTTSGAVDLLALRNIPAAQASTEVQTLSTVFTANTDVWLGLSLTGTTATAGESFICATLTELNVADVNANAIP